MTARVVIVTDARDDETLVDLLAAGIADLMARRGGSWPGRAARAIGPWVGNTPPPRVVELFGANDPPEGAGLTGRQRDVLRLVARGQSNKEIARDLGVSPATVKTHVAQLIAIMGATNRTDAAMKARGRGML